MNTLLLSACIIILAAAVIATNIATRREGKFLKERTDDLLLRTHHLEHPEKPKKFMTSAGEISINVEINKEEFDEQLDQITEDLDAVYNEAAETLKTVREIRAELELLPAKEEATEGRMDPEPGFRLLGRELQEKDSKPAITHKLFEALQLCRYTDEITDMQYIKRNGDEHVLAIYGERRKRIDVTADSGFALIKDVIKGIEEADYE